MRTVRILLLIMACYLAGAVTADLMIPIVLARRNSAVVADPSARGEVAAFSSDILQSGNRHRPDS